MAFGTMIGWGWIMLSGQWAADGGMLGAILAYAFGSPIWGKICIIGAICGILTSWNGFLYGSARVLFSLANAKMMPAFLGKVHPKHKTPSNAVLFVGALSTFSCLLGSGALTWLVNAASFGTVKFFLYHPVPPGR